MSSGVFGRQVRGLDYSKTFRGRVVNRVDPLMEGRVGVFIPNLVTEHPSSAQVPSPKTTVMKSNLFENQRDLNVSATVTTDIYIWARPDNGLVEGGNGGTTVSGDFRVPKQGTMVTVYFEDADPGKPYYRMTSPTVAGDVVDGAQLGKGTNTQSVASNWKDPAARVNIDVIRQWDSGSCMYFDGNANANCFVIRMANGHYLMMGDAAESGIVLQTAGGHLIQMDENSKEIRVRTQTGNCSLVMNDNGDVTGSNKGKFSWDSQGDMDLTTGGNLNLTAQGAATLQANGGNLLLQATSGNVTLQNPDGTAELAGNTMSISTGTFTVNSQNGNEFNAGGGSNVLSGSSNTATPWFSNDPHGG